MSFHLEEIEAQAVAAEQTMAQAFNLLVDEVRRLQLAAKQRTGVVITQAEWDEFLKFDEIKEDIDKLHALLRRMMAASDKCPWCLRPIPSKEHPPETDCEIDAVLNP